MKRIFILTIVTLLKLPAFAQEVNSADLKVKDGLIYLKKDDKPFTGKAITYTTDKIKESSIEYTFGIPNGLLTSWYPNGAKQVEGKIEGNSKTGNWIAWYSNGKKLREGNYIDNKENGLFTWWFENGNINKKGNYKDGVGIGEWKWYYENGNLKQIGSINGETNEGHWKDFYENGKLKNEGDFENGKMIGTWTNYDEQGIETKKIYNNGVLLTNDETEKYIQQLELYIKERDFNNAISSINNAISTLSLKTEENPQYMNFIAMKSKVYALFNHLNDAERTILNSSGIPSNDVEIIIQSIDKKSITKLKDVANNIEKSELAKTKISPHIALSLIYNILGDSINLRKEQQLMMDRSNTADWVLMNSMAIYGYRGSKEENNGILNEIIAEFDSLGVNHKNKLQQAYYLILLGRFEEAQKITKEYLKKDSNDVEFLQIELNIYMSIGDTEKMKSTKEKILKINPKAFDE